ncbi:hypothetical protein ACLB2K_039450 [Fragaria x ananassa]
MEFSGCLKAYWSSSSRNKTAEHFTAPEEFDPSRFENGKAAPAYSNVPFGSKSVKLLVNPVPEEGFHIRHQPPFQKKGFTFISNLAISWPQRDLI